MAHLDNIPQLPSFLCKEGSAFTCSFWAGRRQLGVGLPYAASRPASEAARGLRDCAGFSLVVFSHTLLVSVGEGGGSVEEVASGLSNTVIVVRPMGGIKNQQDREGR